ncbi:hypothetical protein [Massilia sp. BSC265]|uniref:hypothetical protein n=1 Tax=Massilia sp. BSC265 TaxID=1549812 RepID=UPI000560F4D1|nr:hypothetical protein [Massilia sp. BSC265]
MHIERIHFEAVFDVAPGRGDFSFRSGGRTEYGVNLRRGTIPRAGATYAVAFGRAGDWSSVLGWRDLAAQEVMLNHSTVGLLLARLYDIYWYGLFVFAGGFVFGGIRMALAFAALFIAGLLYVTARDVRTLRHARYALLSADDHAGNPDKNGAQRPGAVP